MFMKRAGVLLAALAGLVASGAMGQEPSPASAATPKSGAATLPSLPANPQLGGATTISYYRVGSSEFQPFSPLFSWIRDIVGDRLISLDEGGIDFHATVHLPGGALLKSIEFDNCDTNVSGPRMIFSLYPCDYLGNCGAALATLNSGDNQPGADCSFVSQDLSSAAYTVNNNLAALSISVQFAANAKDSEKLAGAIIGYQLQVSPDPPTATFPDVPVGHPFHQFVEALVKAGITAGYPDGRFGVDDSITRGQMAVFLAKALGLNWPQ